MVAYQPPLFYLLYLPPRTNERDVLAYRGCECRHAETATRARPAHEVQLVQNFVPARERRSRWGTRCDLPSGSVDDTHSQQTKEQQVKEKAPGIAAEGPSLSVRIRLEVDADTDVRSVLREVCGSGHLVVTTHTEPSGFEEERDVLERVVDTDVVLQFAISNVVVTR